MKRHGRLFLLFVMLALLLTGPGFHRASLAAGQPQRDELDSMGDSARETLLEHRPDLAEQLEGFPGYAVIAMSTTKIPGIGTGLGYGVIYDNRSDDRSYIQVTQFEVGGGLGAQKFKAIILFREAELLDRMIDGGWRYEAGADFESNAGDPEGTAPVSARSGKGYKVFKLAEGGAVASVTLRVLYAKPYLVD